MKQEKNNLNKLLENFKQKENDNKFLKLKKRWNFENLDKFVLSFEKLNEAQNVSNSLLYGNISKKLTKIILENDLGSVDFENQKRYTNEEILNYVKNKKDLYKTFMKMYEEILKRNFWKIKTPLVSLKYDLLLDRCNNDYERFKKIHSFLIEKKEIEVKNLETNKKEKITIDKLEDKVERTEIEKIYYLLINKVKRKRNGKEFLEKFGVSLSSKNFKNKVNLKKQEENNG